jgi:hypothetical protein
MAVWTFLGDTPTESVAQAGVAMVSGAVVGKAFSLGSAYAGGFARNLLGRPAAGLVHFTDEAGHAAITESGVLMGARGIFAVPAEYVNLSQLGRAAATTIASSKVAKYVNIPTNAASLFQRPLPLGPYSLLRRASGTHVAPGGIIDLATGEFTANTFSNFPTLYKALGPSAGIYAVDAGIYGALGAFSVGIYEYTFGSLPPPPSPEPPDVERP